MNCVSAWAEAAVPAQAAPTSLILWYSERPAIRVAGIAVDAERDHSEPLRAQAVKVGLMLGARDAMVCLEHVCNPSSYATRSVRTGTAISNNIESEESR